MKTFFLYLSILFFSFDAMADVYFSYMGTDPEHQSFYETLLLEMDAFQRARPNYMHMSFYASIRIEENQAIYKEIEDLIKESEDKVFYKDLPLWSIEGFLVEWDALIRAAIYSRRKIKFYLKSRYSVDVSSYDSLNYLR